MTKHIKIQSGVSIVATIIVLLILSLFVAVAVSLVTTGAHIGVQETQGQQAFDIAEAGLQKTLNYIIKQKDAGCATSETCACTDADDYANTNPSLGAGSFNVATTATHVTTPTTLSGNINATVTSISVSSTAGYSASGRIMIDREVIEYTSTTATTFDGCKRGIAGTTAATHVSGTRVGQKQCLITSTGSITTNPLATVQRQVSTVTELQNGWTAGGGGAENLNEVHCTDTNNCWAVGTAGTIMQWDGVSWRKVTSPTTQDLFSVFMVSATDGWAVGDAGVASQRPLFIRWNGTTWSAYDSSALNINQPLNSVYCTAWNNCWAVGDPDNAANERPLILFWDGTSWTRRNSSLGINQRLNSIYMLDTNGDGAADDGWTVGDGTGGGNNNWLLLRWNDPLLPPAPNNWKRYNTVNPASGTQDLNSVSMASTADGWAVGVVTGSGRPTMLRWNTNCNGAGTTNQWNYCSANVPITNEDLLSVDMVSANDGWAVGTNGSILRWNNPTANQWNIIASPSTENLNSVYMVSANDGWAVGDNGAILRWDGTSWTLWGGGRVLRWNSASWTDKTSTLPAGFNQTLRSVSMLSYVDGWVVGSRINNTTTGWTILRWDPAGNTWTLYSSINPATGAQTLRSVYMTSAADGWTVGNRTGAVTNGWMFLRWNKPTLSTWNRYTVTTAGVNAQNLNSVSMLDTTAPPDGTADDGWAVGDRTGAANNGWTLFRWNNPTANTWNLYNTVDPATVAQNLISVSMISATDGWAVGNRTGAVTNGWMFLRWNNPTANAWNRITVTTAGVNAQNLNSVFMISATDGWAVGTRTGATTTGWTILRWNNPTANTWNLYNTVNPATVAENLRSVYCLSNRECWAVGDNGTILIWNGSQWSVAPSPSTANLYSVYLIGTSTPSGQWEENY